MLSRLVAALHSANSELSTEEVADALWLAGYIRKADSDAMSGIAQTEGGVDTAKSVPADFAELLQAHSRHEPASTASSSELASSDLYLRTDQYGAERSPQMSPIRSPAAVALPNALGLGRALRPFKRRIPSRTPSVLNEMVTATRIAETGLWLPVLEAAWLRWLDVALIVDESASMIIWRQTVAELRLLLEREGAFRNVRTWGLSTDAIDGKVRLYTGTGWNLPNQRECSPHELVDPSGQRLFLIVTDCVSRGWDRGTNGSDSVPNLLAIWSRYNSVAIIQVLPQRLWLDTALDEAVPARLRALSPGSPNIQLLAQAAHYWDADEATAGLPVPIVTLEPQSILAWAQAVARAEEIWIPGYLFNTSFSMQAEDQEKDIEKDLQEKRESISPTALERVNYFRAMASPIAYRLAELLSAVPVSLPIIHLIRQTMLPEAQQTHIAEVFLGGLLEVIPSEQDVVDPDYVEYDFIDGVRELLLSSLSVGESLEALSKYVESHFGQVRDFQAILENPLATGDLSIGMSTRRFARIAAKVLSGLGGKYSSLAHWLEEVSVNTGERASEPLIDQSASSQYRSPEEAKVPEVRETEVDIVLPFEQKDIDNKQTESSPDRVTEKDDEATQRKAKETARAFETGSEEPNLKNQSSRSNPYFNQVMIRNIDMFFGRANLLRRLYDALANRQCISILGQRSIGKSSFLWCASLPQMQALFSYDLSHHIFVFLDLREYVHRTSEDFFQEVSRAIVKQGAKVLDLAVLGVNGHDAFINVLDQVAERGFFPVLLLDSFDKVTLNEHFSPEFFGFLRAQASSGYVSYVTASMRPLYEVCHQGIQGSPFFNIFSTFRLGPLAPDEAYGLITRPAQQAGMPFTETEIALIRELAGRHPFFIQRVCYLLFEEKKKLDSEEIDRHYFTKLAYNELLPLFRDSWEQLTEAQQKQLRLEIQQKDDKSQEMPELSGSSLFRDFIANTSQFQISAKELDEALRKIQDLNALGGTNLRFMQTVSQRLEKNPFPSNAEIGVAIREVLREALKRLGASSPRSDSAPEWRYYNILYYRYFKYHLTNDQIAARLGLSTRQYYRERAKAIGALLDVLFEMGWVMSTHHTSSLSRNFITNTKQVGQFQISPRELEEALRKIQDLDALGDTNLRFMQTVSQRLGKKASPRERGMVIRDVLFEAFEYLKASGSRSDSAPEWLLYNILYYRYFSNNYYTLKNEQIAARLGLSNRQYYRVRDKAIETLLNVLLEWSG